MFGYSVMFGYSKVCPPDQVHLSARLERSQVDTLLLMTGMEHPVWGVYELLRWETAAAGVWQVFPDSVRVDQG